MRSILLLIFISVLAIFMTCTSSAAPASTTTMDDSVPIRAAEKKTDDHAGHEHDEDEAPRITLADAKKAFDDGEVIFLDTRSEAAYNAEHIKGAVNIPMSILSTRYNEIPKGKKIITYCS